MDIVKNAPAPFAPESVPPPVIGPSRSERLNAKVSIAAFDTVTDAKLLVLCGVIVQSMTGNPLYPSPSPSLDTLSAAYQAYSAAVTAAKDHGKAAVARRKQLRGVVVQVLRELALYVQRACGGDRVKLIASGFTPQRQRGAAAPVPSAPQFVRLAQGKLKGQLLARCNPVANALTYEWRYASTAAPTAWVQPAAVSKARLLIEGLTAGTTYTVQVRVIGSAGPSEWSEVASAMSL